MRKIFYILLPLMALATMSVSADQRTDTKDRNRLALAERFTASKLGNMLFSTTIDPHWFKSGEKFWYSYKTGDGISSTPPHESKS